MADLRAAAERLRASVAELPEDERAEPWTTWFDMDEDPSVWVQAGATRWTARGGRYAMPTAHHIAVVASPDVVLVLADLLEAHAEVSEANDLHDGFDLAAIDDTHPPALRLAAAILRERAP